MRRFFCERGQSTVEFVGTLPLLVLAGLVAWQIVLVGHVAWDAAGAARSGARARVVGRDFVRAARAALPAPLRAGTRVAAGGGGAVRVSVPIPLVIYGWRLPVSISAAASLGS
jgi:hypothetical protein